MKPQLEGIFDQIDRQIKIPIRDQFIIEKYQQGFSGDEIIILLKKNNFKPITRARIYQILEKNGIERRT
jgi:DNA-binding transcriptional regulator YhcF (GntR family)